MSQKFQRLSWCDRTFILIIVHGLAAKRKTKFFLMLVSLKKLVLNQNVKL